MREDRPVGYFLSDDGHSEDDSTNPRNTRLVLNPVDTSDPLLSDTPNGVQRGAPIGTRVPVAIR
jgi:hypothetical protein